jgi:hypothetical protein
MCVQQADASKRSYTVKLTTPGLYYFYSDKVSSCQSQFAEATPIDYVRLICLNVACLV